MAQISSEDGAPADSEPKDSGEAGSWLFSSPSSTPATTPPTTAAIAEASSSKMPSSNDVDDKDVPSANDGDEKRDATVLQKDANWKAPTGDGSSNGDDSNGDVGKKGASDEGISESEISGQQKSEEENSSALRPAKTSSSEADGDDDKEAAAEKTSAETGIGDNENAMEVDASDEVSTEKSSSSSSGPADVAGEEGAREGSESRKEENGTENEEAAATSSSSGNTGGSGSGGGGGGRVPPHYELQDKRLVNLNLDDLNQHLVCRICKGYFREAHTITECLHTFCKNCLLKEFDRGQHVCPHCKVELGPHPLNLILYDRTMQELVNKILPHLEEEDAINEEKFYRERGIKRKPDSDSSNSTPPSTGKRSRGGDSTSSSSSSSSSSSVSSSSFTSYGYQPGEAEMNFKLSPDTGPNTTPEMKLGVLDKPFLKTSGKLKVCQLRKYIAKKLGLEDDKIEDVEILCNGETLGPELNLYFIRQTRWMQGEQHLLLNYRKSRLYTW